MIKDEVRFSLMCEISMALKSSKLQQEFEIICKNLSELEKENAELNDKLNNLASVAEVRLGMWQKYEKENKELKEKLNKATEILKVVLNKWKEERWILQSEKEVKMIENVMKEAEKFLKED